MNEAKQVDIYTRLRNVQVALKAPKSQRNSFGNYNFRSCEDILEALKPLLDTQGLTLIIGDTIELIGNRYYVKAIAKVIWGDKEIFVSAYAREEESKKGMDGSQITGAASSYARKYSLNGLFAIDDTKDADSHDNRDSQPSRSANPRTAGEPVKTSPEWATDIQKKQVTAFYRAIGATDDDIRNELKMKYGVDTQHPMTKLQAQQIMSDLK